MKIAVTGGAGFIASHIVDAYIELGHEVTILDNLSTGKKENINPKARFIEIDITSNAITELFRTEKFDVVNHHAAQVDVRISVNNPIFDAQTNILGGINIYQACADSGIKKIIFASSGGTVYGDQEYFPADENHPTNPCSPYGIAKLTNEKYLFYYKEVCGLNNVIFRYANIYGPRQNPHGEAGVVAIFANKMFAGQEPVINGDGTFTRDYVYVHDVVRANVLALGDGFSGTYNIGTAVESDVNFIFRNLKRLTGSECPETHGPAKSGEQIRSVLSFDKISSMHGWSPQMSFADGLADTVEFFRNKKIN